MSLFNQNVSLLPYNSFSLEVNTPLFASYSNNNELIEIIKECKAKELPFFVLGGGCNIIFTGCFKGVIIHPISNQISMTDNLVIAEAGVEWDTFVEWCVERGLSGLENLSYIPGSVGASPVQNIGAYGAEAANTIEWVEYLDTQTMEFKQISNQACEFGYRESIFKQSLRGRAVITRVAFRLNPDFDPNRAKLDYSDLRTMVESMEGGITLRNIREAVTAIRKSKLPEPKELGNAGSFFKNPGILIEQFEALKLQYPNIPSYPVDSTTIKVPAGWLIDTAGWKGYRDGSVGVHTKQALVLVNYGGATSSDILELAGRIVADVEQKFGITISLEVNVL